MAVSFISDEVVTSSSDTSTATVTVPSDCSALVFIAGGWDNDDIFPGTTLTIGGAAITSLQTHVADALDKVMIGYKAAPATGSQTLSWDWTGSGAVSEGVVMILAYFKGVNQSSPILDSDKSTGTTDVTGLGSPTADDMMVGGSCSFDTPVTVTGSSQTSLSAPARFNLAYLRGAYKAGASTYDISGGDAQNVHVALVLAAAAAKAPPPFQRPPRFFGRPA